MALAAKSAAVTPSPTAKLYFKVTTLSTLPLRVRVTLKSDVVPDAPSLMVEVLLSAMATRAGTITPVTASAMAWAKGVTVPPAGTSNIVGVAPPLE